MEPIDHRLLLSVDVLLGGYRRLHDTVRIAGRFPPIRLDRRFMVGPFRWSLIAGLVVRRVETFPVKGEMGEQLRTGWLVCCLQIMASMVTDLHRCKIVERMSWT